MKKILSKLLNELQKKPLLYFILSLIISVISFVVIWLLDSISETKQCLQVNQIFVWYTIIALNLHGIFIFILFFLSFIIFHISLLYLIKYIDERKKQTILSNILLGLILIIDLLIAWILIIYQPDIIKEIIN